ncbi:MAG: MFS transporter, partial [Lachnospirales bacterium]
LSTSGIGGLLAATIGTSLISINWRYAYVVLGAMFIVSCLLIFIFVPDMEEKEEVSHSAQIEKISFKEVICNRNVIFLSLAMMLLNFIGHGNMSWLPTYLSEKFSVELKTIGTIMAFNAIFSTIATMIVGVLLSKVFLGKEKHFIVISAMLVSILFFMFPGTDSILGATLCNIAISILFIGPFIGIFTWPHKLLDPSIIGTAIGIINTGGMIGGFLGPMILGKIVDANDGSFYVVYMVLSVATIMCGLLVLGVKTNEASELSK